MKNIKSIYLLAVICFFSFYSCINKVQEEKKFFDIPRHIKSQIDTLETVNWGVSKVTVYNGDTSKMNVFTKDINWNKEFAIFLESDINKPVYYADLIAYNLTDSVGIRSLYRSRSGKYPIKEVDLVYDWSNRHVEVVSIRIKKENLISSTEILAVSVLNRRYFISGEQHFRLGGAVNKFMVSGVFNTL